MTIEITDREAFKGKFGYLMAATASMKSAGTEPPRELVDHMIDEFLNQFEACTPAPAVPKSAGWVVVNAETGYIPFDFKGVTYEASAYAQLAIVNFLSTKDYGKVSDYRVVEATYFG